MIKDESMSGRVVRSRFVLAGLGMALLSFSVLMVTRAHSVDPSYLRQQAGKMQRIKAELERTRGGLAAAQVRERANPTKASALATDAALEQYNAAVLSHRDLAEELVREAEALIGADVLKPSNPAGAPGLELLIPEYRALKAELQLMGQEPHAKTSATGSEREPNDTSATANPMSKLELCTEMAATINPAADQDFFSFSGAAGDRVWAYVDTGGPPSQAGTSRDSEMRLFAPDGTTLIESDDDDGSGNGQDGTNETGLASAIAGRSLSGSGTHFLRTNAFNPASTIDPMKVYLVVTNSSTPEIESNDTPGTATPIALPVQVRTAAINTAGDVDYYSFDADPGDLMYVNVDCDPERDGGTDLVVEFRSPADALLFSADSSAIAAGAAEAFCFYATTAGTHFVKVQHSSNAGTGTYDIMIDYCSGGAIACTLSPATASNPAGGMHTVTATVTQNGTAFPGRDVFFTVTGRNTTSGFGPTTNAMGQSTFTYTDMGSMAMGGTDTITACTSQPPVPRANPKLGTVGVGLGFGMGTRSSLQPCDATCTAMKTWTVCTISCPANITTAATSAGCGAAVVYPAPTTTGNCGTVTCSPASGSFFAVGTTTVTCTTTVGPMCPFTVTVTNAPPTANAGPDQTVAEGSTVTLSGSGTDPNMQTLTFAWTQTGGPAVTINNANMATANFTAPEVPNAACVALTFKLVVTDPCGTMAMDTVVVGIADTFVLTDDKNGNCVIVTRTCITGTSATYCFKTPNGSFTGPCTLTFQAPGTFNAQSTAADPRLFQGIMDIGRCKGNGRLTLSKINPVTTFIIVSNVNACDDTCTCVPGP